jgi:hypothetical protein
MNQNKQHLSIGQVVYILSNQGQNIIPAMVVEEKTIQTLQGVNVSWKIALGSPDKQKIVDSTNLNGEIYTSLEEIKSLLIKKLNDFVEQAVDLAKKRENSWYGKLRNESKILKEPQTNSQQQKNSKINPESLIDGMDDFSDYDSNANNSKPVFSKNLIQLTEDEKQLELKEKLKNSILPTREELEKEIEIENSQDLITIKSPDGNPIIANVKKLRIQ